MSFGSGNTAHLIRERGWSYCGLISGGKRWRRLLLTWHQPGSREPGLEVESFSPSVTHFFQPGSNSSSFHSSQHITTNREVHVQMQPAGAAYLQTVMEMERLFSGFKEINPWPLGSVCLEKDIVVGGANGGGELFTSWLTRKQKLREEVARDNTPQG